MTDPETEFNYVVDAIKRAKNRLNEEEFEALVDSLNELTVDIVNNAIDIWTETPKFPYEQRS